MMPIAGGLTTQYSLRQESLSPQRHQACGSRYLLDAMTQRRIRFKCPPLVALAHCALPCSFHLTMIVIVKPNASGTASKDAAEEAPTKQAVT
jgi:hypothetical protein